jgi:hypothetical protein
VRLGTSARAAALVIVVGCGALLTSCSSGSSSPTTTRSSMPTSRSTTSAVPAPTTTGPAGTTTTAVAGPARCATTALTGSVSGSSGAAGTIETTVALKSTGTAPCSMTGYPGLQMLSASGSDLPTQVTRKGAYSFTAMAPTTVILAPGQQAYVNIGYSDVPVGNETTCPTSASLEITPPDAFDHLVVTAALAPCGGGTLVVSPVFAAGGADSQTTAPPTGGD